MGRTCGGIGNRAAGEKYRIGVALRGVWALAESLNEPKEGNMI